ncbi:hypothetical protein MAR_003322, partial [Mya arenaria]
MFVADNIEQNIIPGVIFSRLDYFLISDYLRNTIPKSSINLRFETDHSTVILNVNTHEQIKDQ